VTQENQPDGPPVDIGIPTHGRPRYLVAAVESVLAQTYRNWRLLISEDGPRDAAAAAVEPYLADSRIRYEATGEAVGAAANHTRLIQAGSAPYVALLHDDDLWEPTFLERRVEFLESHPDCGWVFSANTQIDADGREIGRSRAVLPEGVHQPESFALEQLRHSLVGGIDTMLVRRDVYESVGAHFDERFRMYDEEMYVRLAATSPVGYLATWDVAYRIHGPQTAITGRWGESKVEFFEHLEAIVERQLPGVRLSDRERANRRASALLSAALDAAERGERRRTVTSIVSAAKASPRTAASKATVAAALSLVSGSRGRAALTRLRNASRASGLHDRIDRTPGYDPGSQATRSPSDRAS
jgi:glycosyltransferase involved in cell wall biosynthesis